MQKQKYSAMMAILVILFPFLTKGPVGDLFENAYSQRKGLFAWEVDKTHTRMSWKIKRKTNISV